MSASERADYQRLTDDIGRLIRVLTKVRGFPERPFHEFMAAVSAAAASDDWSPARDDARLFQATVGARKKLMATSESKLRLATELAPAIWASDRAIVFTESIEMAESLGDQFRSVGLRAAAIHSELSAEDRRRVFRRFDSGGLKALLAPRVLDEGIDVPAADLAVVVSGSRTRRQMIQRMGRVLRRKSDQRLARIAILYLEDTTEDPERGAHEAFLSEVTAVAEDRAHFTGDELESALIHLCMMDPYRPPPEPRLAGQPRRPVHVTRRDDDGLPASEFYGL